MTTKTDYGHWDGPKFDPTEYFGFVYTITNTLTERTYIGQKQFHFKRKRPPLKGRKNKRHYQVESDWRTYTGSSKSLNTDIEEHGMKRFTFEIVELHESKWELNYYETKRIIAEDAVIKHSYYNEFLGRVGRPPERVKI